MNVLADKIEALIAEAKSPEAAQLLRQAVEVERKRQMPGSLPTLVRRFRSAASGLWYENPHASGSINAVELDGQILERKDGEKTMPWICRAAKWASAIHSANKEESKP